MLCVSLLIRLSPICPSVLSAISAIACSLPSATYGETGMVWPGAMGFLGAYSQCLSALLVWRWQMLV